MSEIKKKKFTRGCCVVSCKSRVSKEKDVHFYAFPNKPWEIERRKKWIAAVRRITPDGKPWIPSKYSLICSRHFITGKKSNHPLDGAFIPTIFPECYAKNISKTACDRARRNERRRKIKETIVSNDIEENSVAKPENENLQESTRQQTIGVQTDAEIETEDIEIPIISLSCCLHPLSKEAEIQTNIIVQSKPKNKSLVVNDTILENKITKKDKRVGSEQIYNSGFHGFEDLTDDSKMKAWTGVTISFFNILLPFVKPKTDHQPAFYKVLSAENRLLLFLMKMKTGLPFINFVPIFKISLNTVTRIFYSVLDTLYKNTKTWIFWPSREVIEEMLPATFKNYPKCRAIIDCTEIKTHTPPTVEQRAQMYSSYKCAFTVKYLIAISPSGLITFISKGYGGRSTDGYITNDSGFLCLLEPGDQILADKGFPTIKSEMIKRKCVLVMPPFASNNQQFTEKEVMEGYSIASVRIHVERAIQRVKIFKILREVSIELLPYIDKIMYVACVFANNKEPLISQENNVQ